MPLEEYQHDQVGTKQAFEDLVTLTDMLRIEAQIVARPADVTEGDYVVDLFEAGFPEDDAETPKPTRQGFPAFAIGIEDHKITFEEGAIVPVIITASGRAIIVPAEIPRGEGIYKILTLVDDKRPGRMIWDHPRFW
jgi:hypothetical protein